MTFIWPLTLNYDLDLEMSLLKMWSSMSFMYMPSFKSLSLIVQNSKFDLYFDLWPLFWHLTLTSDVGLDDSLTKMLPFTFWTFIPSLKSVVKSWKFDLYLTFDLELWPWPWNVTTQNVKLHELHVYDRFQVPISNRSKL